MDKLGTISLSPDILSKSNIGLWAFEFDEGEKPRMYVDDTMLSLMGLKERISPQQMYDVWYDRVDSNHFIEVTTTVNKMKAGIHAEVQYQWHHLDGRTVTIRCGGIRNYAYKKGIRIEGSHQDVTKLIHYQKKNATELLAALSDKFSYVFFIDSESGAYELFVKNGCKKVDSIFTKFTYGTNFYKNAIEDIYSVVHPEDQEVLLKAFSKENLRRIARTGETDTVESRWFTENGEDIVWMRDKIIRFIDEDGSYRIVVGLEDITEQKQKEQALLQAIEVERQSMIDPLTGCRNRLALDREYADMSIKGQSIGVVMCDLNGLKKMNDISGHGAGDQFIRDSANIMLEIFGQNKVYRIGGDEFVVVELSVFKEVFEELVQQLRDRCTQEGINISIGHGYSNENNATLEDLFKIADENMYEEKRRYYRETGLDMHRELYSVRNHKYLDALMDFGMGCKIACKYNLTNDTYEVIHFEQVILDDFRNECKTFSSMLNRPVKMKKIHPEDVEEYVRYTTYEFIKEYAKRRNGRYEHVVRFRYKYSEKEYHRVELRFFSARDYSDEEQVGYLLIKDMGLPFSEDRMLFSEILKELSKDFESILYVDFDKDEVYPYQMNRYMMKRQGKSLVRIPTYWDTMETYISQSVSDKDKDMMYSICRKEYLEKVLKMQRAFSFDHRVIIDESEVYYRVKFSNLDGEGELHHCVIGFVNINSEMSVKYEVGGRGEGILIVDQNEKDRQTLKRMLQGDFLVLDAENTREAEEILKKRYNDLGLVVLDATELHGNEYDLLLKMRELPEYKNISVIVDIMDGDEEKKNHFLELGAQDYIMKPYHEKIVSNRIYNILQLKRTSYALQSIKYDTLTGLYTKEAFYQYAQYILDSNPKKHYIIEVADIMGFKAINEQYGRDAGERLLKYYANAGMNNTKDLIIGGRIGSNTFACIRNYSTELNLDKDFLMSIQERAPILNTALKLGFYSTQKDRHCSIQSMCDKAKIAIASIKDIYGECFAEYDDSMMKKLLMEQRIIESMDRAIREEQFQVFYQPKHDINQNHMAGAEALVRWIHPEMGFMNPGVFLPIFENNGFISKLDRYVWKKACKEIKYWMDQGKIIPISVNVSRKDFQDEYLADFIIKICDENSIPYELLHLEITESAYSDNPEQLKRTINKLHEKGFIIELDDFGTGYSSITALNSMDIDIIKLDRSLILEDVKEANKSILEFTMNLARMMGVNTVQEGVETEKQLQRVKTLGCKYVQGYFFSKPLPKEEFRDYVRKVLH